MAAPKRRKCAMVCVQAFPPLLKVAGGVAKRYLTLCRALIDGLGYKVVLVTPVDVKLAQDEDVQRWLREELLVHRPARGVYLQTDADGNLMFMDVFSIVNTLKLLQELVTRRPDIIFTDDVPLRVSLFLLARFFHVPTVATTHTDGGKIKTAKGSKFLQSIWASHVYTTKFATIHASVSKVFARCMQTKYGVDMQCTWPPILWSADFREDPENIKQQAVEKRVEWLAAFREKPKAIMLFVGRWSVEKRIHLLIESVPDDCALVICGDGVSDYADKLTQHSKPNVLVARKMLNSAQLRVAYSAADLFVSASDFETLGNTVVESLCCGTPVAVQPAQGHLEFVVDDVNSYFVDFDDTAEAKKRLTMIVMRGVKAHVATQSDAIGKRFREQDFPAEIRAQLIQPAMDKFARETSEWYEPAIRLLCLAVWAILWMVMRIVTRLLYALSVNPRYEIIGQLGSAAEQGGDKTNEAADSFESHLKAAGMQLRRPALLAFGQIDVARSNAVDYAARFMVRKRSHSAPDLSQATPGLEGLRARCSTQSR
mmetsp:Transcript_48012/g.104403  ORF Transcript_48012/g.104403 Transcript_48012/m.104403 type:complete len:540 (+) Transcript_48012:30-1649(+)